MCQDNWLLLVMRQEIACYQLTHAASAAPAHPPTHHPNHAIRPSHKLNSSFKSPTPSSIYPQLKIQPSRPATLIFNYPFPQNPSFISPTHSSIHSRTKIQPKVNDSHSLYPPMSSHPHLSTHPLTMKGLFLRLTNLPPTQQQN